MTMMTMMMMKVDERRDRSTCTIEGKGDTDTIPKNNNINKSQRQKDVTKRQVRFGGIDTSSISSDHLSRSSSSSPPPIVEELWYTEKELRSFKRHAFSIANKSKNSTSLIQEETESLRGLETQLDRPRSRKTEWNLFVLLEHLHSMHEHQGSMDTMMMIENNKKTTTFDIQSFAQSLNKESIQIGEMQAAQDSAEAYKIYLEGWEPEFVNQYFQNNDHQG